MVLIDSISNNKKECLSFCATIDEVTSGYSNYNYYAWLNEKDKSKFDFFIIPSPTQRLKQRLTAEDTTSFSTTWNNQDMASALLSWMSGTIKPVVWLNVRLWDEYKVVLIYDGESKMHFVKNFIDNEKVFEVLQKKGKGYVFTSAIEDFKSKLKTYAEYESNKIMTMLNEFKTQRHKNEHSDEYLTSDWMKKNGYDELLDRLRNHKVTVVLEDLHPGVEADVYQILGSAGASQECSQLAMSHVKASMWEDLFHKNGKPDNELASLFDKMVINAKQLKRKVANVHPSLFKQILNEDERGYKEWDVYLYNLFLFSFLHVDESSNKLLFTTDLDYKNLIPRFVRWKKSADENGNVLFFKKRADAFDKLDLTEKQRLISQLKTKVIPKLNKLFIHISTSDFQALWRKGNDDPVKGYYKRINAEISKLWKKVKPIQGKKVPVSNSVRSVLNFVKDDVGVNISMLMTLEYLVSAEDLNENNVDDAYRIVLKTFVEEYPKYIFSRNTQGIAKDSDSLKKGRETFVEKYPSGTYNSLGSLIAQLGVEVSMGMDTTAHLMKQFFQDITVHELNEEYGDVLSTTKARRKLFDKWDLDGYKKDDFAMINPHGDIFYESFMDIGHTKQHKDGNELTVTNFIVEERDKNQQVYKDVDKDQVLYYSLSKIKLEESIKEALQNGNIDFIVELDKVRKTLDWLVDYHGIELDETIEFNEEGYLVLEKDAA